MEIPTIELQLQGLKVGIISALNDRNEEINSIVKAELGKLMTEEWVTARIQENVRQCLEKAIDNMSSSYKLQTIFREVIEDILCNSIHSQLNNGGRE